MRMTLGTMAVMLVVLCAGSVTWAQAPAAGGAVATAGQQDAAAMLRGKDVLSPQDSALLKQWILDRVAHLEEASRKQPSDLRAMATTKRNMADAAAASGPAPATVAFRTAFADLCSTIFPPYLGAGNDPKGNDPRVALCLVQVLGSLKQVGSLDTMMAALSSKYPAVRLCAAKAIRDMRSDIVATRGNQLARILQTIQQAGAKEGDAPTAMMLYEAVDFHTQAQGSTGQVVDAMLEMLKGRQQLYANDGEIEFYPDAREMNLLQGLDMSDAQKQKAIPIVLGIVEGACQRWASVAREEEGMTVEVENPYDAASVRDWHLRYQLAYVTQEAETLLKKLGAVPSGQQAPDTAALMASLSTADQVHAMAEKWQGLVKVPAAATAPTAAVP